jgi:hypothetical protein
MLVSLDLTEMVVVAATAMMTSWTMRSVAFSCLESSSKRRSPSRTLLLRTVKSSNTSWRCSWSPKARWSEMGSISRTCPLSSSLKKGQSSKTTSVPVCEQPPHASPLIPQVASTYLTLRGQCRIHHKNIFTSCGSGHKTFLGLYSPWVRDRDLSHDRRQPIPHDSDYLKQTSP